MMHETALITTIVAGLVLAFVFGAIANRLQLPPLVGYLLAGVVVGPYSPGFVADASLASQLAEIGVILLMFGVGLNFSLKDLLSVQAVAIPGAIGRIVGGTAAGRRARSAARLVAMGRTDLRARALGRLDRRAAQGAAGPASDRHRSRPHRRRLGDRRRHRHGPGAGADPGVRDRDRGHRRAAQ